MLNVSSASRTPGHSPHESMFRALKWLLLRVFAAVWELGCAAPRPCGAVSALAAPASTASGRAVAGPQCGSQKCL